MFTRDFSGAGPGIVTDAGYGVLDAANPTHSGEAILIFLTGLGAVTPPVTAGSAAPGDPLSRAALPVKVTVGGMEAQVVFAGLAPGFSGLYQINAVMPEGVAAGDNVEVVVTAGDVASPAVTIAVR